MLQLISSLAAPFSPNFWVFTIIRFFVGTATAGIMILPFTVILEFTGPRKRELVTSFINLPLTVGEMIMPLFAYYLRSWNTFSLGIAIPNLLFLVYFFLVPESPKWLISTGQLDKASEIMARVAKRNHLPANNMLDVAKRIANEASSDGPKVRATYLDLIRRPAIRMNNVCCCVSWFILGLSFYGSNQYIGQTSSNVFVTIVLAGGL
ncbi:putative organic cation transporter, partial [Operophtera brumata]